MRIRNILEMAILKYIKDNGGSCITAIAKHTGIGRNTTKDIIYKLIAEKKVDFKIGQTEKKYNTLIYFERTYNGD